MGPRLHYFAKKTDSKERGVIHLADAEIGTIENDKGRGGGMHVHGCMVVCL